MGYEGDIVKQGAPAEDYRLYNEILPKPASFRIDEDTGARIDIPAKRGIDIKTCTFKQAVDWLADKRIKKSQTSMMYVLRHLAVRFPDDFARDQKKIMNRQKLEHEMIMANAKNDAGWFGQVSYQNMVRLDHSLDNPRNKVIKEKNEKFRIVRK